MALASVGQLAGRSQEVSELGLVEDDRPLVCPWKSVGGRAEEGWQELCPSDPHQRAEMPSCGSKA